MGFEEMFQIVPFAARRTEFANWPYLSVHCQGRPLWNVAVCKCNPRRYFCISFNYNCLVESETGEYYQLFAATTMGDE